MGSTHHSGNWLYGDSWEKFPIEPGQIWTAGQHEVMVADVTKNNISSLLNGKKADMSYIDPPWNSSNINAFYTKAGLKERRDFKLFLKKLIEQVKLYSPNVNYMEMGFENVHFLEDLIESMGGWLTNSWDIFYYRIKPCHLIRFTFTDNPPVKVDFTGMDDDDTPHLAISSEKDIQTVLDFCTGRGLTGRTAHALGKTFIGTELNKRRLACLLNDFHKQGLTPQIKGQ
jgi:DNA modification methylase